MTKVICKICKDMGYTSSPELVRCQCGGRLIAADDMAENKKEEDEGFTYIA